MAEDKRVKLPLAKPLGKSSGRSQTPSHEKLVLRSDVLGTKTCVWGIVSDVRGTASGGETQMGYGQVVPVT